MNKGLKLSAAHLAPLPKGRLVLFPRRAWFLALVLVLFLTACTSRATPTVPPAASPFATQQPTATPAAVSSPSPMPGESGRLPNIPLERGDASRGERLFSSVGCIGCHTVKGVGGNVGPELTAVARRAPSRAADRGLVSPQLYFIESLVYPKAYLAPGYPPDMPDWKQMQLSEQAVADLVAYLMTLVGE
ncbi:MAG: c-type cytochrome [Chloroflexi bacterium]|nr:c-type cytochrome [Chloroflexota bacterium]